MLPHVIRYNSVVAGPWYASLIGHHACESGDATAAEALADRIRSLLELAGMPTRLSECGVTRGIIPLLATEATQQWTARFNPRPVAESDILQLYDMAF
jgi:alcohol dehydrogenase